MEGSFSQQGRAATEASLIIGVLQDVSPPAFCLGIVALAILYTIVLGICRLYFSPLAGFPGSKLAIATGWYQCYYEVVRKGQYSFKIKEMHEQYGPIIRINPWELSIKDPDWYSQIYVSGSVRRTNIDIRQRTGLGLDGAHLSSETHELHRMRRKPMNPYFSRQETERAEPMIADKVRLLAERFRELAGTHTVVQVEHVYAAFVTDVVGQVCFEEALDLLRGQDFSGHWYELINLLLRQIPVLMQFPFLARSVRFIPVNLLLKLYPGGAGLKTYTDLIAGLLKNTTEALERDAAGGNLKGGKVTLAHCLLVSDMPDSEKKPERLVLDLMAVMGAGTATTTRILTVTTYHVLADPAKEKRLREELREVMSGFPERMPRWAELERLPYLTACIKEGLRLGIGIMRHLPRCSPDVDIRYHDYIIPKNTPVGLSTYLMHMDADVYPEPLKFIPDRWLGDYNPNMNRNLVAFSKGSRNCLGMYLAYAEMNMAIATMFRPGGPKMSLYETDDSDVEVAVDLILASPRLGGRGTRVVID